MRFSPKFQASKQLQKYELQYVSRLYGGNGAKEISQSAIFSDLELKKAKNLAQFIKMAQVKERLSECILEPVAQNSSKDSVIESGAKETIERIHDEGFKKWILSKEQMKRINKENLKGNHSFLSELIKQITNKPDTQELRRLQSISSYEFSCCMTPIDNPRNDSLSFGDYFTENLSRIQTPKCNRLNSTSKKMVSKSLVTRLDIEIVKPLQKKNQMRSTSFANKVLISNQDEVKTKMQQDQAFPLKLEEFNEQKRSGLFDIRLDSIKRNNNIIQKSSVSCNSELKSNISKYSNYTFRKDSVFSQINNRLLSAMIQGEISVPEQNISTKPSSGNSTYRNTNLLAERLKEDIPITNSRLTDHFQSSKQHLKSKGNSIENVLMRQKNYKLIFNKVSNF